MSTTDRTPDGTDSETEMVVGETVNGDTYTLPVGDVLTGRLFATGKSGAGKSNTGSVIAEELLERGHPLLIVDVDGEYWGLKEEYEVLHVGATEECDLQVAPEHAGKLAGLALEQHVPIVLDVSGFVDGDEADALVREVGRELFARDQQALQPFLMVVEEIHEYLLQQGSAGETGEVLTRIAKRGRKRGLGIVGLSQRPADVDKAFITQSNCLVWHRLTWENDTDVVKRVVSDEYADAVSRLDDGGAFVQADWDDIDVQRVQFRRKRTFDAGATPGLDDVDRPELKAIDEDLLDELEAISEQHERRQDRIAELEARIEEKNEKIDESEHSLSDDNDDDNGPEAVTDGGVVTDGGDETDWDLVAGDEPSRNGTRRIVSADEARTPYTDSSTYYDQLLGVEMEIGSQYNGDTIQYVNIQPQIPKRARGATGVGWLCRLAVDQGDYDDLYGDGDADDPLPGYQAETTGDYREADPEDPRGDGVYERDDADSTLTAEIADVVTREGGRIPIDFSAAVQNEGYARSRDWRVYAPAHNPHHVAAAVTDLLRDTDGVSDVRVHVSDKSASQIAWGLRANGIGHTFDSYVEDSEDGCIERSLRELRWESGLSVGRQRILQTVPTEARERLQAADFDDQLTDYESQLHTLHQRPGDAWDYHEVTIHINEEAADPYYG